METASYLRAKARQCRDLAQTYTDVEAIAALKSLAESFETQAIVAGTTEPERSNNSPFGLDNGDLALGELPT